MASSSPPSPSTPSSSSASDGAADADTRRRRGRAARYIAFVLIVAAVPLSLVVRRAVEHSDRVDPLHSGPAPGFELPSLSGETVSLAALRGRPVVVVFWASWCGEPCQFVLPLLAEMHRRYPDVAIVGILFREDPEVGRAAAEHGDATWPTLVDPGERVAAAYGIESAPATFFLRPDHTIAGRFVGPVSIGLLERQFQRITG